MRSPLSAELSMLIYSLYWVYITKLFFFILCFIDLPFFVQAHLGYTDCTIQKEKLQCQSVSLCIILYQTVSMFGIYFCEKVYDDTHTLTARTYPLSLAFARQLSQSESLFNISLALREMSLATSRRRRIRRRGKSATAHSRRAIRESPIVSS